MRPAILAFALCLSGCTTPGALPRPEFPQRAAPRPGQDEIELLAGIQGRLVIEGGCLGLATEYDGTRQFTTIVWPWNARLLLREGAWYVENIISGRGLFLGQTLAGGGGHTGSLEGDELSRFNRYLTRNLSRHCAEKGALTLNRDFGPFYVR